MYISWIFIKLKKRVAVCWGLFTVEVYSTLYTFMYSYIYFSVSIVQLLAGLSFSYTDFCAFAWNTQLDAVISCIMQLLTVHSFSIQLCLYAILSCLHAEISCHIKLLVRMSCYVSCMEDSAVLCNCMQQNKATNFATEIFSSLY